MKTSRIKLLLPTITTREDAEFAMSELALHVNQQRQLIAQRDAAVLQINQNFEGPLSELAQQIDARTNDLRAWAESNPEQFKDRKSIDLVSGKLGFRTGTPKLALLSRAFTWEKVLQNLKRMANRFVRTKEEVDKEAILAEHAGFTDKHAAADLLKLWGVKVVQDESFFIEPSLTDTTARQTTDATV